MLRLELNNDGAAFAARVSELEDLPLRADTADPNLLARAAVELHHAYGAFDSALARIAKVFGTEPSGVGWHRSLLETMAMEVPGLRPALVNQDALPDLRELLAFRHFFRHAYVTPLDPAASPRCATAPPGSSPCCWRTSRASTTGWRRWRKGRARLTQRPTLLRQACLLRRGLARACGAVAAGIRADEHAAFAAR